MPPGSDIAAQNLGLAAAQSLSGASINPPRGIVLDASGNNKTGETSSSGALSARERLRAHVHRNLQIQQEAAQKVLEKGETLSSPATTMLGGVPSSAAALKMGLSGGGRAVGLEQLYAPIKDTRLGVSDFSDKKSALDAGAPAAEALQEIPMDMSIDAGGVERDGGGGEGEEGGAGFTEGEPFLQASDWSGLETVDALYYSSGSGGGAKDVVGVDDEWVQGIYDMEGMAPDS